MSKDYYRHHHRRFSDTHPELPIDPDVVQPGVYRWPPHFRPSFVVIVFAGGCLGTYARYWVGMELPSETANIPIATMVVNLLGAFMLGLLLEGLARLGKDKGGRRVMRLGIGTGFMGAFTTYSSFAVESDSLLRHGASSHAWVYLGGTIIGGLIASTLGIQAAAAHHKRRAARS